MSMTTTPTHPAADGGPSPLATSGDVTALASVPPTAALLVGVGSHLHVLDAATGVRVGGRDVLAGGARVHGLTWALTDALGGARSAAAAPHAAAATPHATAALLVVVHGDRHVAAWRLGAGARLTPLGRWVAPSWVHDALPLPDGRTIAVGTADNAVTVVDLAAGRTEGGASPWPPPRARCGAAGVLYSMALAVRDEGALWAACGTAFLDVVVWRVPEAAGGAPPAAAVPPLHTLAGHTGSIHRVAWSPCGALLASASDDRSVRVWRVGRGRDDAPPTLAAAFTGHGARLWDVAFLAADLEPASPASPPALVLSACEDGAARAWRLPPASAPPPAAPAATLRGHTGRGVWRCAVAPGGLAVTAGSDHIAFWRVSDFIQDGGSAAPTAQPALLPPPPGSPPLSISCLAAPVPGVLLVGARDGSVWRVDGAAAGAAAAWRPLLPPAAAVGAVVALDATPCRACGDLVVVAGFGRGQAAMSCACGGGGRAWAASPGDDLARLPPLATVALPDELGGRVVVTASTLGDVRAWRVAGSDTPPTLLAAAPPRRARRREAAAVAVAGCGARGVLYVVDAAGGVSAYSLPPGWRGGDGGGGSAPAALALLDRTTTPGAAAATCLAVGPAVSPPPLEGGAHPAPAVAPCCGTLRVGDARGCVTTFSAATFARVGGERAPFPVVTYDGAPCGGAGGERLLVGFRGDDWCASAPGRGGVELLRERGTGGWRRPAVLVPACEGHPPVLVWATPHRAGGAGLAVRPWAALRAPPPRPALPGGHSLEVLAAAWLTHRCLVTAGEDGRVVVTAVGDDGGGGGRRLTSSARAGGLSDGASLRALAVCPTPCSTAAQGRDCLVFAAGAGGGGVTAWRAWWADAADDAADDDADDDALPTLAWAAAFNTATRTNVRVSAAVPRAMGAAVIPPADGGSTIVGVAVVLSTGALAVHAFDAAASAFVQERLIPAQHAGAALCVACGAGVVASGGADGRVVVRWAAPLLAAAAAVAPPDTVITGQHQSGVLALSVAAGGGGGRTIIIASGGDDQALALAWLDAASLAVVATAVTPLAHASAVRGVWTDGEGGHAVTAGLDRTLHGWRVGPRGALPARAWRRRTQVPAPAGLAVVDGGAEEGGRLVAVVGRGCQIFG